MNLNEILSCLPFYTSSQQIDSDLDISSVEMDSRKVQSGSLFVCIEGFTVDGHDFINQAIENGAKAIIAQKEVTTAPNVPLIIVNDTVKALAMLSSKFYQYPTRSLSLIGVTGTNGKTTVTYLLEKIFNQYQKKTGVIGTIQTKIGEKAFSVANTTPDALSLQQIFHRMVVENVDQAIMEVSSHALDQGRVYGCEYDIAVFTNLSQDHLDYHKDMDDYLRAKSLLFAQLGNVYEDKQSKFAVINADDSSSHILKRSTVHYVMTYGCKSSSDVMAKDISLTIDGTSFLLVSPVGKIRINSRLIGMFNIYNMLAAATAAIVSNVPLTTIKGALESVNGVDGRFEPVVNGQKFGVIVDYAHTPDSLENVLQTIREFSKRKVYCVVGCGGDRDRTKRPLMAKIAVQYADHAIFTSDNPRTEDPLQIIQDMVTGLTEEQRNYEVIVNRKEAIIRAVHYAEPDDIILIAGKGHETYQQIGHEKIHFDDREVASDAIKSKENV